MKSLLACALVMSTLGLGLAGCGDDTGGSGSGGSSSASGSGTGDSAAAGNDDTSTATGNGPSTGTGDENPQTCAEVCEYQPQASTAQANCVGQFMQGRGYPIATTPECLSITDVPECNDCYDVIDAKDPDCAAAFAECW